jgi:hypothetical protein
MATPAKAAPTKTARARAARARAARAKPAPAKPAPDPRTKAIPDIYARWTLDCVVEAALAIANDYRTRYRQYRDVPDVVARLLADMKSKVGADPKWPNKDQRTAMVLPLLGPSDADTDTELSGPFCEAAKAVRAAAIAYSERVYDTGEPMLRQAFVEAARQFHAYLTTLGGSVVANADEDTEPMFEKSRRVLSAEGVAKAFGLPAAPADSWPVPDPIDNRKRGYLDGNGAYLIEEVARVLQDGKGIAQQQFLALQRAAVAGARTINAVLNNEQEKLDLTDLIGDAYSWSTALRDWEASQPKA